MKNLILAVFTALLLLGSNANAATISWANWNPENTHSGVMTFGSQQVEVTLTGLLNNLVKGDYYYNNAQTIASNTYLGLNPTDLIKEWTPGKVLLTFSKPVLNPYFALVSVGQSALPVNYAFDSSFEVLSSGSNLWGPGTYSVDGNTFSGREYNGILAFTGEYSSIAFDITPSEYWHGFNVGATAPAPAPEPASMVLGLMGIGSLFGFRKKTVA